MNIMNKALLPLLLLIITLNSSAQSWIRSDAAAGYNGKLTNIVGLVTSVDEISGGAFEGIYIHLAAKDSAAGLTLLIRKTDLNKFRQPVDDLVSNYVHVKGNISMRYGKPYMILRSAQQISVVNEAPEMMRMEPY
jgi:hypothetical protein